MEWYFILSVIPTIVALILLKIAQKKARLANELFDRATKLTAEMERVLKENFKHHTGMELTQELQKDLEEIKRLSSLN